MVQDSKYVKTPLDKLTYKVIGCAMAVHRELGPGLREDTYQRALENYLSEAGISYESQRLYSIYDDPDPQRLVGYYIPDFVVENSIIVEIKALNGFDNCHVAQVIGYLAVSGCPIGFLINFGERSLHQKRIFPPKNITQHQVNRQWLFIPNWMKG